jgi:hypothetical protein
MSVKWLPLGQIDTTDIKRAPDARVGPRRGGARGNINPVPKNDIPDLERLLLPFHRWVGEHHGRDHRILLDLLASPAHASVKHSPHTSTGSPATTRATAGCRSRSARTGPRRSRRPPGIASTVTCGFPAGSPTTSPASSPTATATCSVLRRAPRRRSIGGVLAVSTAGPATTAGSSCYCSHDGHDAVGSRGQNRRRWRHSIHDWRHAAAVWQLFELRLDPEDVAQHLGHGDGYTLYQLYVGARPGRAQRAAKAVEELGDPRIR